MKNIAIIVSRLNGGEIEKIAGLLSKGLTKYYNVYLFLLHMDNIIYEHGGKIINIGNSNVFYEYEININKKKYHIDCAISFLDKMNYANIRTRKSEKVIIFDEKIQSLRTSPVAAHALKAQRYYSYADAIISCSEGMKFELKQHGHIQENVTIQQLLEKCVQIVEGYDRRENTDVLSEENSVLRRAQHIVIYGAGVVGKSSFLRLSKQYKIDCFVISKRKEGEKQDFLGVPIKEITEIDYTPNDTAVIIGVSDTYHDEVVATLLSLGFTHIVFPYIEPFSYSYYTHCDKLDIKSELLDWYKLRTGKNIDIDHPITFNEKIQWLKLYDSSPIKTELADKYAVRQYVSEKIGDKYLIPLLGVWDSFGEIDFSCLPEKFVLKCNHGSGANMIVHDKAKLNYTEAKQKFDQWMDKNYSYISGFEMHYSSIIRKIIAEEMLEADDGEDLRDYKVFVFNGKAKLIQVDIDRRHVHRRNIYTTRWEYVPCSILYPTAPEIVVDRPDCLGELIRLSEILAEGFIHARVDFYICKGQIYFGELTFTHGSGIEKFEPEEYGVQMGSWMELPKGE